MIVKRCAVHTLPFLSEIMVGQPFDCAQGRSYPTKGITYGLWAKGCYTDTQKGLESYTETIYTLLDGKMEV